MSEQAAQSPELVISSGHVSLSEEQQLLLQATVAGEINTIMQAQEVRQKVDRLMGEWDETDVLKPAFVGFLDGKEVPNRPNLQCEGKILDLTEVYMPLELKLQTTDPAIHSRQLGDFHLGAINLDNGKVIISSVVKRDNPSYLEGENESWFSFVVDPNVAEQPVELAYLSNKDDYGEATHQALLPVLAGEQTTLSPSD